MSRQLALDTIDLKNTDRIAHTEYSMEYHVDYAVAKTGMAKGKNTNPQQILSLQERYAPSLFCEQWKTGKDHRRSKPWEHHHHPTKHKP